MLNNSAIRASVDHFKPGRRSPMKSTRFKVKSWFLGMALAMLSMFAASSAHAVDGCKLLLCLAGNWRNISECRPTVLEAFRDMARGRPFPTCGMSGAGNSAGNNWADQSTCPAMYRQYDSESGAYSGCTYPCRITVNINGALWSHVYWDFSGNTTTWYSDTARTQLTQPNAAPLDDTFYTDLMRWNSQIRQCTSNGGTPVIGQYGAFERCNYPDYGGGG
jgi:hypothetical protein